ncbi:alpha/beta fold hydrolase [Hymenobacter sp. BT186]|uniref:Alpha/beta fold hydrolase n=1 Tax=Hymenobacter telluris TaxID=2816474 RepID=A0A939F0E1_9BACT|nr:alpha/beta fold hydrolase [Hymenobacter telluris]MBO0359992.1 alpha/beta fold hydrolase [Hymenobacter telluris]MBW3376019.1 lysophospholipase [Hymenobacter norwichensis]
MAARRKWQRRLLLLAAVAFGAMNLVAAFHAWRFTHFTTEAGTHTDNPEQLTATQKLWVLLTGIKNPKPVNHQRPSFPYRTIHLTSPNGQLEAWYGAVPHAQGTVALFHGYTSSKGKLLTEAATFRRLGYNVLLTDFAGNGGSTGNVCTVGHHEAADVAAVTRWLQRRPGPVFIYANSMGAVATLRAEAELGVRPTANVLECPYGSMLETAQSRFRSMHVPPFPMANLLVFWGGVENNFWAFDLNATDYATRISTPTLLLWGTADPRVTRPETDAIYTALRGPKQRQDFPGSGHEPYWRKHKAQWEQTIQNFTNNYSQSAAYGSSTTNSTLVHN